MLVNIQTLVMRSPRGIGWLERRWPLHRNPGWVRDWVWKREECVRLRGQQVEKPPDRSELGCASPVCGGSIRFPAPSSHCCSASGLTLALLSWPQSCSPCLAFFLKELCLRAEQDSRGKHVMLWWFYVYFPFFSPQRFFTKLCMQTGIFVCFTWVAFA